MIDPRIVSFLDYHRTTPDADMPAAIRRAIEADGGTVMDPTGARHASHLYEFYLYGVAGRGLSMTEAAMDWLRAARQMRRAA